MTDHGKDSEMEKGVGVSEVYVVAWEYWGGGGFDWYYDRAAAEEAYEAEKANCEAADADGWTRYFTTVPVDPAMTPDEVTELVDEAVEELPDERPAPAAGSGWTEEDRRS